VQKGLNVSQSLRAQAACASNAAQHLRRERDRCQTVDFVPSYENPAQDQQVCSDSKRLMWSCCLMAPRILWAVYLLGEIGAKNENEPLTLAITK
jgi:hypothetical protein